MRNPKFKEIIPNYKRNVLEITLEERSKRRQFHLPFSVFRGNHISSKNRFVSISIDKEVGDQAASFALQDGSKGDFPADLVLYYCDPTYEWSPLNQLKRAIKGKLQASKISVRVMANALKTSPSQVMRLLQSKSAAKQVSQLFHLAELAGYEIHFQLKKKIAA